MQLGGGNVKVFVDVNAELIVVFFFVRNENIARKLLYDWRICRVFRANDQIVRGGGNENVGDGHGFKVGCELLEGI